MALDRDLGVLFSQYAYDEGCRTFLDGLGATGVRGIRMAQALPDDAVVTINEIHPQSVQVIIEQAAANNVSPEILNQDVRVLLSQRRFDYVDIDPYGSPAPFVHGVVAGATRPSYAAVTATDKATLCGVHPAACWRRYGAVNRRGEAMKEVGVRILIGFLVRVAASYEVGAVPVFAYSHDHYFRAYLRLHEGARRADEALRQIGWVGWDDGWQVVGFHEPRPPAWRGPVWCGPLLEDTVVAALAHRAPDVVLDRPRAVRRLLHRLGAEIQGSPLYYECSRRSRELGIPQPPMAEICSGLHDAGYPALRTHFDSDGLKTAAPLTALVAVFQRLSPAT
jgi:tRNA (guanine26-N2/guanine27-N2)-dimethyltransferase